MLFKLKTIMLLATLGLMALAQSGEAKWWNQKNRDVSHNPITVAAGEVRHGDVVSDKSISVDGEVDGDCIALGGPVTVTGKVTGDVIATGGAVAVSGAVRAVPGTESVSVDLASGVVRVQGAPDAAAVRAAIEEEGYKVAAMPA